MRHPHNVPKQRILTAALLLALAHSAAAQDATAPAAADAATTDGKAQPAKKPAAKADDAANLGVLEVRGIAGSMQSSMDLKRESQGVVDGIVAEDIGKFPDTNLAESLQRITGVSIDRSLGEGSKVTVRGVGPEFNLVLLNGRQMPTSATAETSASNSRAFDFANLASESISAVEVYKTGRAANPTGGIGATINIKTARPLDHPGFLANIGVKGVTDTSNNNLPNAMQGSSVTPEVSGIFSNTFFDDRFGISLSASYQERNLGYNQAAVANGWRNCTRVAEYSDVAGGGEWCWGQVELNGSNVTNAPQPGDIYGTPQNLIYSVNGVRRQRTNGQLTMQYEITDNLTATLDYTYSENKVQTQRNELSVWFGMCCGQGGTKVYTDGPVSGPLIFSENYSSPADIAMAGANYATKNVNKSTGFNLEWKVNDSFTLELDTHKSSAQSGADSPYGSNAVLGTASFTRASTSVDFSHDFPVISIGLPNGATMLDPSTMLVTGSSFRNSYQRAEIDQTQLRGHVDFGEASRIDFGLSSTEYNNRSAFSNVQRDTWGGATSAADYPDSVWHPDTIAGYFGSIDGSNNPNLFNQFFTWDFETVRALAAKALGDDSAYRRSDVFTDDRRTREKSESLYVQYSTSWDGAIPVHAAAGVRLEKTDVASAALVPDVLGINWVSANEFGLVRGTPTFTVLTGSYQYQLPDLDLSFDLTDNTVLRASYGWSIGRPGWGDIQGGQTLNDFRVGGGSGAQGNPGLKPLESENLDLSFEWYYGKSSYASIGYFRKNVDNYIGTSSFQASPFNLHTPVGGAYWNAALSAGGCGSTDYVCIRDYIFLNFNGQPGVVRGPDDSNGNQTGTISGLPGDPLATFTISSPTNQKKASIDGWEFNIQHLFGESGFGVSANYTIVNSSLKFDNAKLTEQFALEGLSDSANLVGFFENEKWSIRAAYNWRGEFLTSRFDGACCGQNNPVYTEPFGQLDINASYKWNDKLTLTLEGINLTDSINRLHGRLKSEVLYVTQTGPRYMFGLRYKF
jgi:TonB-dependent receptor